MDLLAELFGGACFPDYAFRVSDFPDNAFSVLGFTGSDHALSDDYRFTVELLAPSRIDPAAILGKAALLELAPGSCPVHGVIASFSSSGELPDGHLHIASLTSPLHPLSLGRSNRVFIGRSAPQILEEIARGIGLPVRLSLREEYPVREFTVQFDESDLDFLQRLAATWGVFHRIDQGKDGPTLLFHDTLEDLPRHPVPLLYREESGSVRPEGTVFALRPRARLLAAEVELRDYNYRTPETPLRAAASLEGGAPGAGRRVGTWENAKDLPEAQRLARLRQEALDGARESFLAETDCRDLAPGLHITVTGHPELDGDYLVLGIEHRGDQRAGFAYGDDAKSPTYRNTLHLIRAGVPWRPAVPAERRFHGTITARVESPGGDTAHLDEQGRYRVRLDFDAGEAPAAGASHAVRMMQPYGGSGYGLHLSLHQGTEVLLACVGGHLDRPVIMGALPNPDTPTPVAAGNPSQNILRTAGGNELLLDDRKGKEKIELFTAGRKNILALDADGQGHTVRLATAEGKMELSAARTLLLSSGDTHTLQSGADHLVTVEGAQRLTAAEGEIAQQAVTDIRMRAGQNFRIQSEQEDIVLTSGENLIAEAGEEMSVEVRSGDLELLVASGSLSLTAAGAVSILGEGGGAIRIGQGAGVIEIAPDGSISIDAPEVEIIGNTVALQGGQNFQGGGGWGAAPVRDPEDPVASHFAKPVKPELVIGVFFDGTGNNKDAEPWKHTNVAKLWELYPSGTSEIPIYIAGIGTKSNSATLEKSVFGEAMGVGIYGAAAKLEEARGRVIREFEKYHAAYGSPESVVFDVFGFSRGAMLARHFVNMVNAGIPDLQGKAASAPSPIYPSLRSSEEAPSMDRRGDEPVTLEPTLLYPPLAANVRVRFLGIFDAVGSFFLVGNDKEGFINPHLSPSSAGSVYHITARNEIRKYFPLTRIAGEGRACSGNFLEEESFGVHSDIGGGYGRDEVEELLAFVEVYQPEPTYSYIDGPPDTRFGVDDLDWTARMRQKACENGCKVEFHGNQAFFFTVRNPRPELARVALHKMHAKAVGKGVPLRRVNDEDAIPPELSDLIVRANNRDHSAFDKLKELYIHTSHRDLLMVRLGQTAGRQPARDGLRETYPNRPERAIPPSSIAATAKVLR